MPLFGKKDAQRKKETVSVEDRYDFKDLLGT